MLAHNKSDPHYRGGSMDEVLGRWIHIIFQGPCCFTSSLENAKFRRTKKRTVSLQLEVGMCPSGSIQLKLLEE